MVYCVDFLLRIQVVICDELRIRNNNGDCDGFHKKFPCLPVLNWATFSLFVSLFVCSRAFLCQQ